MSSTSSKLLIQNTASIGDPKRYPPPKLVRATPVDIPALASLTASACVPDLYIRLMHPTLTEFAASIETSLRGAFRDPSTCLHLMKAISPDGELMGYLGLVIIPKTFEAKGAGDETTGWPSLRTRSVVSEEAEFPAKKGLLDHLDQWQRRVMGDWCARKRLVFVDAVYTLPKFQRRGVATALMKWANELADREGVPSFLGSSPFGHKLYLQCGYHDIDTEDVNLAEWALPGMEGFGWGVYRLVYMLRLAEC